MKHLILYLLVIISVGCSSGDITLLDSVSVHEEESDKGQEIVLIIRYNLPDGNDHMLMRNFYFVTHRTESALGRQQNLSRLIHQQKIRGGKHIDRSGNRFEFRFFWDDIAPDSKEMYFGGTLDLYDHPPEAFSIKIRKEDLQQSEALNTKNIPR